MRERPDDKIQCPGRARRFRSRVPGPVRLHASHNIRKTEALNGMAPAGAAGVVVADPDKLMARMQNTAPMAT